MTVSSEDNTLRRVQLIRKAVLAACILGVCVLAAVTHSIGGESLMHEWLETFGMA